MLSTDGSALHVVLCTMPPNWLTLSVLALLPEGAGLSPARHDSTLSHITAHLKFPWQLAFTCTDQDSSNTDISQQAASTLQQNTMLTTIGNEVQL